MLALTYGQFFIYCLIALGSIAAFSIILIIPFIIFMIWCNKKEQK